MGAGKMIGAETIFFDPPGKRARLGVRIARFAFFAIFLAGFLTLCLYGLYRSLTPMRWTLTPCQIVSSSVEILHDHDHQEYPYVAHIEFRYFQGAKPLRSTQIEIDERESHSERAAVAYGLTRAYPVGANFTCYVNPADASDAVLTRGVPFWVLAGLAIVGVF